jgi:hypothetical protein
LAELAEAAAESAAAPEAGVASVVAGAGSVLAVSCFAQAVSISAAIRALRASLVFIDQYPERSKSGEEHNKKAFLSAACTCVPQAADSIESPRDWKYVSASNDSRAVRPP